MLNPFAKIKNLMQSQKVLIKKKELEVREVCFKHGITEENKQDEFLNDLFKVLGVIK